jgi:D-alanyl-lipoteichoic acid acyltransferase DltB (MBOAT superfamily)
MGLISSAFLLFFVLVWGSGLLLPLRLRPWLLLAASLFFYAIQGWLGWLVLVGLSLLVWLGLRLNRKKPGPLGRRLLRALGVLLPLAALIIFKYGRLLTEGVNDFFTGLLPLPPWLAPLGISFFIFKLMSLSIDQLRADEPEPISLPQVLLYSSFFPQILSGPIDRARNLIPQLWNPTGITGQDLSAGLTRIVWGLFKKVVVADRLGLFVNPVFSSPGEYQGLNVLMAVYFYAFQIYCDFSGYSDMAIGLCRLFGIRSLENFARPYSSISLSDFWNRWHMTLSTWLRDYLFLPVSYALLPRGASTRLRSEHTAYVGGIMVTMILGGLWHAPSWTMMTWGGLHGVYLALGHLSRKRRRRLWKRPWLSRLLPLRPLFARLLTFHLVALAWIFFKAPDFGKALAVIGGISFKLSGSGLYHLAFTALFLLAYMLLAPRFDDLARVEAFGAQKVHWRIIWLTLLFIFTLIFAVDTHNEFIYFKF